MNRRILLIIQEEDHYWASKSAVNDAPSIKELQEFKNCHLNQWPNEEPNFDLHTSVEVKINIQGIGVDAQKIYEKAQGNNGKLTLRDFFQMMDRPFDRHGFITNISESRGGEDGYLTSHGAGPPQFHPSAMEHKLCVALEI